jgi:hypothetical protein
MGEPTLEILAGEYDVIIFKHCYPVSKILPDTGHPDINSEERRLENYRIQYNSLKNKMHEYSRNKFIVWTPAVHVQAMISEDEAKRTLEFHDWIMEEWKEKADNIFIWDFYGLETGGGLYLKEEYSEGVGNSHPNSNFSARVSPMFAQFVIDVIQTNS